MQYLERPACWRWRRRETAAIILAGCMLGSPKGCPQGGGQSPPSALTCAVCSRRQRKPAWVIVLATGKLPPGIAAFHFNYYLWIWILQLSLGAFLIPGAIYSGVVWLLSILALLVGFCCVVVKGRWPDGLFRLASS